MSNAPVSVKKIAETILNRRNSLASGSVEADLRTKLSYAELNEAMRRNWVHASEEWGTLAVSNLPRHLEELKEAAEAKDAGILQESVVKPSHGADLMRSLLESKKPVYRHFESQTGDHNIGDKVVVAQDGESYEGVVAEKTPTGDYKVSFGEKKPKMEKLYKAAEVAPVAVKPGTPTPASTPATSTIPAVAGV